MPNPYPVLYRLGFTPWEQMADAGPLPALLATLPAGRALDAGCGTGKVSVLMAEAGWEVTGVDTVQKPLEAARQRALHGDVADRTTFLKGDVTRLDEVVPTPGWDLPLRNHLTMAEADPLLIERVSREEEIIDALAGRLDAVAGLLARRLREGDADAVRHHRTVRRIVVAGHRHREHRRGRRATQRGHLALVSPVSLIDRARRGTDCRLSWAGLHQEWSPTPNGSVAMTLNARVGRPQGAHDSVCPRNRTDRHVTLASRFSNSEMSTVTSR